MTHHDLEKDICIEVISLNMLTLRSVIKHASCIRMYPEYLDLHGNILNQHITYLHKKMIVNDVRRIESIKTITQKNGIEKYRIMLQFSYQTFLY